MVEVTEGRRFVRGDQEIAAMVVAEAQGGIDRPEITGQEIALVTRSGSDDVLDALGGDQLAIGVFSGSFIDRGEEAYPRYVRLIEADLKDLEVAL